MPSVRNDECVTISLTEVYVNTYRRLSKDYERTITSSQGRIVLVSIRLMTRKLIRLKYKTHS